MELVAFLGDLFSFTPLEIPINIDEKVDKLVWFCGSISIFAENQFFRENRTQNLLFVLQCGSTVVMRQITENRNPITN